MSKLEKSFPLIVAAGIIAGSIGFAYNQIVPQVETKESLVSTLEQKEQELKNTQTKLNNILKKVNEMKEQLNADVAKKIYYPSEADLGQESVGFFLYSEVIALAKENNIKIRSIEPDYNVKNDPFLEQGGRSNYYVCDLNMKLISNYKDLRNFIEALYQYEYYLKFNDIEITPYETDKKILLTDFSVRLYSHTDIEKELPPTNDL